MKNRKIYDVHVRLDYKTNQKFKRICKKCDYSKSEFFRRFINELEFKEKPDDRFYESISKLIKIGDNLQIISEKAEYLNDIDKEKYIKEVQKIDELITLLRIKYL